MDVDILYMFVSFCCMVDKGAFFHAIASIREFFLPVEFELRNEKKDKGTFN